MIASDPGRASHGVALDNWQTAPQLAWSFQHIAEILPTAAISRGPGPVGALPARLASVADLPVASRSGTVEAGGTVGSAGTVGAVMTDTMTDGWIVLHDGALVVEEYPGGMLPNTLHLLMSVSKSLVGTVAGALIADGLLDADRPVTAYVPALNHCGYAGATVRHLLDMRSGVAFREDYWDSTAEVRLLEQAIGWAPRTDPGLPETMYDFLLTLKQKAPHGGPFEYRSAESDVLGWVCEAAGGERMPRLMSRLVWSRLGAEFDANVGVDAVGTAMFDGGISAALRDIARFGQLLLDEGTSLTGEQVLPAAWVQDSFAGGADSRQAFAASPGDNRMPGGMYRNQFWFPYPGADVLLCLGIHGQMIYVNRAARVVAAKVSSWPTPQDARRLFDTLAAFDAIAAYTAS